MKLYILAITRSNFELEHEINGMIDEGFEPLGGPVILGRYRIGQAMIKNLPDGQTASQAYKDYLDAIKEIEPESPKIDQDEPDGEDDVREIVRQKRDKGNRGVKSDNETDFDF